MADLHDHAVAIILFDTSHGTAGTGFDAGSCRSGQVNAVVSHVLIQSFPVNWHIHGIFLDHFARKRLYKAGRRVAAGSFAVLAVYDLCCCVFGRFADRFFLNDLRRLIDLQVVTYFIDGGRYCKDCNQSCQTEEQHQCDGRAIFYFLFLSHEISPPWS